jgi:hypothetical protein
LLAEEGSNLRLMWVPFHMTKNIETTIKVVKSDYCKWIKEKSRQM